MIEIDYNNAFDEFGGIISNIEKYHGYEDVLLQKTNETREMLYMRIDEEEKYTMEFMYPNEAEIAFHQFEKVSETIQEGPYRSLNALEMHLKSDLKKLSTEYIAALRDCLLKMKNKDYSDKFEMISTLPIRSNPNQGKPFIIKEIRHVKWSKILENLSKIEDPVNYDRNLISLNLLAKESFIPVRESVYKNTAAFKFYTYKQFSVIREQTQDAFTFFWYEDLLLRDKDEGK